jgi:hypothetical protein
MKPWPLGPDDIDVSQRLPSQPVLLKVAEFFCVSFHHWVPCIHKQRLQTRLRQGVHDAPFDLVLHAIVAATMRHVPQEALFLDQDQIEEQIRYSRYIVETMAVRTCTKESLQALILVVFDHVSQTPSTVSCFHTWPPQR